MTVLAAAVIAYVRPWPSLTDVTAQVLVEVEVTVGPAPLAVYV